MTQPTSDQAAAELAALYILAEQRLLGEATRILRRAAPTLEGAQAALVALRRLVRGILGELGARSAPLVVAMVAAGVGEGRRDAQTAVARLAEVVAAAGGKMPPPPSTTPGSMLGLPDDPFDLSMPHGERAAQAIRDDLISSLDDVRFRLTRWPDDIYKAIVPHGAIDQVIGSNEFTPAQAQAAAWRVFTSQGVRGFTDKSGRDWSMSAYTEMAVRTAAARAYNASHLATMQAVGIHLFSVPNTGHPCPLCFPWQHRVLADEPMPDVAYDATIAEATAAGLFHPNCRHTLIPYLPGYTILPTPELWSAEMAEKYAQTQRQRALELAVRKAKRRLEYALDAESRAEALADVRRAQKRVRDFVAASGLARQSRREQVNLSDAYIKLPTPVR
jgi:hypothetical protein